MSGPIILKDAGNPLNICRGWVARDEALNELTAPERRHIGVRIEMVEGHRQGFGGFGTRRNCQTQEGFGARFIAAGYLQHRAAKMIRDVTVRARIINIPTRKNPGESGDIGLSVGFYWLTVDQPGRAVQIKLNQANHE